MLWALLATFQAMMYGGLNHANRTWQFSGSLLARWRGLIPALIALPLTFFYPPPTDPLFYAMSIASACLVLFHDGRAFDISAKYGANVMLRLRPLVLPCVFAVWLIIHPGQFNALIQTPWLSAALVFCLGLATFFLMNLRKCTVSRAALREMAPVLIAAAGFDLFNKTAMDHSAFPANIFYYMLIVSGLPVFFGMLTYKGGARPMIHDMAGIARHGVFLGFFWAIMMALKNMALMGASNPAYVTAISLTAPFWVSLWMKVRGEKEEADWISGTGLVLAVMMMVLLSTWIKG
jgi:hypothetical protein